MNISVSMIVKNEGKHLKECLESLRFVDEVIIVDTGSNDNTLDIAKEFPNVKIYRKKFNVWYIRDWKLKKLFHYSNARNYSLSKCTKEWILIIDADERIINPEHIGKLINDYKDTDIYAWRLDQVSGVKGGSVPCSTTRLWRNGMGIRYSKIVHETVDEFLDANKIRVEKANAIINHVGFEDATQFRVKSERVIEALRYEKQPYMYYYLAIAYAQMGDVETATDYFNKAVLVPMAANIKAHAHNMLADIYRQTSDFYRDLAYEQLRESRSLISHQNLASIIESQLLKAVNKKSQAVKVLKKLNRHNTMQTGLHNDLLLSEGKIKEMIENV